MWDIFELGGRLRYLRHERHDQDRVDYFITVLVPIIFIILSVICNLQQYVGKPLDCLFPANVPGVYYKYFQINCMLHSTYYWPELMSLNDLDMRRHDIKYIRYYPFIYLLLLVSAIFLILPNVMWRVMSNSSGFGISKIVATLRAYQHSLLVNQNSNIFMTISYSLSNLLALQHRRKLYNPTPWYYEPTNSLNPNYLIANYLIQKFLYILSTLFIFLVWNATLINEFYYLGIDFINRMISSHPYRPSKLFPHYSLCDSTLHGLKITKYTFECYMTRNVFLDLIITSVWFIIVFSFFLSIYSFIKTARLFLLTSNRNKMLSHWLEIILLKIDKNQDRKPNCNTCSRKIHEMPCENCQSYIFNSTFNQISLETFSVQRLSIDTIFCIYIISIKTIFGDYNAAQILYQLWLRRDIPFNCYKPAKIKNKQLVLGSENTSSEVTDDSNLDNPIEMLI